MKTKRFIAIISLFSAIIFSSAPIASAKGGETSIGLRTGYTTRVQAPIAGLYLQYSFKDHIRVEADIDYAFRHKGFDSYSINGNFQMPYAVASDRFRVFPIVGLNYTSRNVKHDEASTRKNRFGVNVGAGAEYMVTSSLKLSAQTKYTYVKDFDAGIFTVSIGYVF